MQRPRPSPSLLAGLSIGASLALFAGLASTAARTKSPTFDEPIHLVGAFVHRHHGDFRANMEDPPLWHYWAMLSTGRADLTIPFGAPAWRDMPDDYEAQWEFAHQVLYRTPGNDPERVLARARPMMIALGVLLAGATAWLAWRLAGPGAAVVAAALLALDPNFIAHAPLLKNDVGIALLLFSVVAVCWSVGRRATIGNVLLLGLFAGVAFGTKYSGLLAVPIGIALLGLRALLLEPWRIVAWTAGTRASRLAAAACTVALAGSIAYACIWAAYGFRYRAIPAEDRSLDFARLAADVALFRARGEDEATTLTLEDAARLPLDLPTRGVLWLRSHRVLPEAWLAGLLYTHARNRGRGAFILGRSTSEGVWYYFPFAMLVKTPSATLVLIATAIAGALALAARRSAWSFHWTWAAIVLVVPATLYLGVAMTSRLNLGLRHVLPVYPFLFVGVGVVAAKLVRRRWQRTVLAASILLVAVESLAAWPDFLPFFNAAAGGARGGLALLGDSNLDWGQDLPLLADWQRRNPSVPLWLAYFGTADPAHYGIRYLNLARGEADGGENLGGYVFGPPGRRFDPDGGDWGVVAVSATHLQGVYLGTELYAPLRERRPLAVLGGSIYLYGPFGRPR